MVGDGLREIARLIVGGIAPRGSASKPLMRFFISYEPPPT